MRRSTLGNVSPAQLNARNGLSTRYGGKQARSSLTKQQQQPPPTAAGAANGPVKSGRPSLSRRHSSMNGKGGSTQTEVRPVSDKAFQQECVRKLVNFLNSRGYGNQATQKSLQAPSTKDVVNVIHFLLLQLDMTWEFKKIEEEVPLLFKRLGYPVQLSRSALYAAGSPVSWPSLLAALTWLVDLISALGPSEGDRQGESSSSFADEDGVREFFYDDYVRTAYKHFLKGEDDEVALLDEEYVKNLDDEMNALNAELEELEAERTTAKETLRNLRMEPSPLAAQDVRAMTFNNDIEKYHIIIKKFSYEKQAVEKLRDEKAQELAVKKEELVAIVKENEELQEQVMAQRVNAAQVEKMLKEKEILELDLQSVKSRKQELDQTGWDYEVSDTKMVREVENVVSQFNGSVQRLLGFPEAQGLPPLDIILQPMADTPADYLGGGKAKILIKPTLLQMIEKSKRTLAEDTSLEIGGLQEQRFKREVVSREKQEQISKALAHIRELEGRYKAVEEVHPVMVLVGEREEIETRMVEEELDLKNEDADIEHDMRLSQAKMEVTVKACNAELEEFNTESEQILNIIVTAKERAQGGLKRVCEADAQVVENLRELLASP